MKRVFLILSLLSVVMISFAGEARFSDDPALRRGVLSNSLSYYIRHNARPKGQADFYILSDVGAIQEEDDQQGLAHFLEHMAFNGTENFPDKQIINYLESVGVKFGANLNAATSWDYTVYMMKDLPTKRDATVDSALMILRDWAGLITPQEEEIDKERGVIKEELRTRDGADWRSTLSLIGALGRGTKYEYRNLIGYLEGLDSFESEALTRFYHDWYTPNHQAIIVVGDVDVDRVEAQIKELFEVLDPAHEGAPEKEVIVVADNDEPIVEIYTDPEMQYSSIQYFIKRRAEGRETAPLISTAKRGVEEKLIAMMQGTRLKEVVMSPESPILYGAMSTGGVGVIPTLEATTYVVQSPEGGVEAALEEMVEQMERTRQYGFTESELERARSSVMSGARSSYLNRGDRTNNSFVNGYIRNYRFGSPVPSAQERWQVDSTLLAEVSLIDINNRVGTLFADNNHVVVVNAPRKEGLEIPTQEGIVEVIDGVKRRDIEPYEDSEVGEGLLPEGVELKGSSVVSEEHDELFDATVWRLANGIEVVVKSTELKADEVVMRGYSEGGASLLSDLHYLSGQMLPSLLSRSGVGEYSAVELGKVLSGKLAGVSTWVSDYSHGVRGSSTPADLETLLQLLYLYIESPRFSEDDFRTMKRQLRSDNENQASNPDFLASKRYAEVVYDNNLRERPMSVEDIDRMELSEFIEARDALFMDSDNLRFTFVGSIDLESFKPLVERYIGSLSTDPTTKRMEAADLGIRPIKGTLRDDFSVAMKQPKVGVQMLFSGEDIDYTLRNRVVMSYLKGALDDAFLVSVREELGGTYGVGLGINVSDTPYNHYSMSIYYDTNEEQVEQLQEVIMEQLELMARDGATEERMAKSREYMLKSFGNSKEHNSGWISYMETYRNSQFDYITDYEAIVNSVTSEDVAQMARTILDGGNRVTVVMHPMKSE